MPSLGGAPMRTHYCEPDFLVGPAGFEPDSDPSRRMSCSLIEVAHWSLKFDTTIKAGTYASLGVREYWVINARTLATKVHRGPSAKGYASVVEVRPSGS